MRRLLLVIFCLGVIVGIPVGSVPAAEGADDRQGGSLDSRVDTHTPGESAATQLDPDRIVITFQLEENGTAVASVKYWTRLDNGTRVQAFDHFSEAIRSNRSRYARQFGQHVRQTSRTAERRTGREMSIANVTVRAYRTPQGFGIVRYSYRWDGFAAASEDRLDIGPVLGGLYLSEETRLVISWPSDYEVETIGQPPSERGGHSAVWAGPMAFAPSGPRITLEQEGGAMSKLPPAVVSFVGLAGLVLMAGLLARQRRRVSAAAGSVAAPDEAAETIDAAATDAADGESADATDVEVASTDAEAVAPAARDATAGNVIASSDPDGSPGATDPRERELLSNQEILLRELEHRGGRAKQKELVEFLDWSASKGSRVVSELREDDQIETFRIGNQNVLTMPGADLLDTRDPDANGASEEASPRSPHGEPPNTGEKR